jgi:integrase
MARSAATDKQFLEMNNGKWRVSIAVPRDLQDRLGTRLKQPLKTDSLALANRMKWPIVAELRAAIEEARGDRAIGGSGTGPRGDALTREALEIARHRERLEWGAEREDLDTAIHDRAEEIAGHPIGEEVDPATGASRPLYDEARERQAHHYADIAYGRATPIDLHHAQFIAEAGNKRRTEGDDRRAMKLLLAWCERERVRPVLQAISRKVAIRFRDALPEIAGGRRGEIALRTPSPVTLNKHLGRLSVYWDWLVNREEAESNVWERVKLSEPKAAPMQQERPFTDAEVRKLLSGPADQRMQDLMRIGALTGARLDAIVDLKVKDCAAGLFIFKPQKKEPAPRAVPIHPDLEEIVERRTKGKAPEDDLFPEWPAPRKAGSVRERSFKASNHFTDYRRSVGVDHVVPGKRRSLVNFHSWRRWFITKAEQADQPESIIAAVVGHKRRGLTLGRYSGGPLIAQARRCVEAVRLPIL